MPIQCPQCGTVNESAKFCAHCGTPLAPITSPPAPRKGTPGWVWGAVGGGVALVLLVIAVLFVLNRPEPSSPAVANAGPTQPGQSTPSQTQPGKAPAGKVKLTQVSKGNLAGGTRGDSYAVWGQYLAEGMDNKATFYKFDAKGAVVKLNEVEDMEAGNLLDVAVGDMLNAGVPVMVATYETKVYVVAPTGEPQIIPNTVTDAVLMGDYDGDGKVESIFMGERSFNVYRYVKGGDTKPIYGKKDAVNPFPEVWATQQKAGDRNLLFGFAWEGADLNMLLYKWDGLGGPVEIGRYKVPNSDTAQWLASAPTHLGPTFAVTRNNPTSVEFLTLSSDAKTVTSLGILPLDTTEPFAVVMSPFTGQKAQLLKIDGSGGYVLYDIAN